MTTGRFGRIPFHRLAIEVGHTSGVFGRKYIIQSIMRIVANGEIVVTGAQNIALALV